MVKADILPVVLWVLLLALLGRHCCVLAAEDVSPKPDSEQKGSSKSDIETKTEKPIGATSSPKSTTLNNVPSTSPATSNCSSTNGSCLGGGAASGPITGISNYVSENKGMLIRTFYILLGLTGIVVVYFVVKTIRSYRRKSRTKRYGLLSTHDDQLEMAPLDQDDEEDDLTVFDINNRQK